MGICNSCHRNKIKEYEHINIMDILLCWDPEQCNNNCFQEKCVKPQKILNYSMTEMYDEL